MGENRLRIGRLTLALLLISPGAWALGQPFPPAPPDRHETVAGWRVVHTADGDGGREIRLSVTRAGLSIDYYADYWHGNGFLPQSLEIRRGDEFCSGQWPAVPQEEDFRPESTTAGNGQRLHAQIVAALAECGVAGAQTERMLAGFAPAFDGLRILAVEARRHTTAIGCSIEHYPEGEATVRRLCHRR